ncbi:MAG: hypothetical protein ACPGVP_22415, partial [Thiolinea sp.]
GQKQHGQAIRGEKKQGGGSKASVFPATPVWCERRTWRLGFKHKAGFRHKDVLGVPEDRFLTS